MNTSEFNQEFVEELQKRIEVLNKSDTTVKGLSRFDYTLVGVFIIISIILLIFGRFL